MLWLALLVRAMEKRKYVSCASGAEQKEIRVGVQRFCICIIQNLSTGFPQGLDMAYSCRIKASDSLRRDILIHIWCSFLQQCLAPPFSCQAGDSGIDGIGKRTGIFAHGSISFDMETAIR